MSHTKFPLQTHQTYLSWLRDHVAALTLAVLVLVIAALAYFLYQTQQVTRLQAEQQSRLATEIQETEAELASTTASFSAYLADDQVVRNNLLETEISDLQKGFSEAVTTYESLLKLSDESGKKSTYSAQLATTFSLLSKRQYSTAAAELKTLRAAITAEQARLAAVTPVIAPNVTQSNTPPGSGYQRQAVQTDIGLYQVDLIAADLNSTRVVVETASSETCGGDCPVSSLSDFVGRAGGFAGINGPYFCPAEYPSCAGKANSFDTLLMNRNKTYFNSDNNVYSSVPAVIFSGSSARFVSQSQEWGRDTGVDAVIASQPLLLSNGEVRFGGDGDPKKGSRGNRSFIGTKGSTVYIGVVRTATVAETALVLKALGLDNALNLDSGGSTALMAGGKYVAGPGRNTPFGIVLVRK